MNGEKSKKDKFFKFPNNLYLEVEGSVILDDSKIIKHVI